MTTDAIFGRRVVLSQPARGEGYRTNADALLLASFAGRSRGVVMDLGAGVGAIALVMLATGAAGRALLVDDDAGACEHAKSNVLSNGFGDRAQVLCEDVLSAARKRRASAAVVVCNPPYSEPGTSRLPKGDARARIGSLDRFARAAREALAAHGRACFVYPATDLERLLATLRDRGLEPKRLRLVHATASHAARVALVESRAAKRGGLVVHPPLIERAGGSYTPEVAQMLGLRK